MIYPLKEELQFDIYYCQKCKKYNMSTPQSQTWSCVVSHPPGDCCHYNEQEVSTKTIKEMKKILEEAK